jgi:hypothetical protein
VAKQIFRLKKMLSLNSMVYCLKKVDPIVLGVDSRFAFEMPNECRHYHATPYHRHQLLFSDF